MIKIDYKLSVSPPVNADTSNLRSSKAYEFEVTGNKESYKDHYADLREALAKARNTVGDDLTKWKELVGKDEEQLKGVKQNDKEEEEEDAEEEEQGV